MATYEWDVDEYESVTCVRVTDTGEFVRLLNSHLLEGCRFLTDEQCAEGVPANQSATINSTLLGSVSEFAVYVVSQREFAIQYPFIGCFRGADPFGKGNFPLVDVRLFHIGPNPDDDRFRIIEIKTTRDNPSYFRATLDDFRALYPKSRIFSTAEHLKADLMNSGNQSLIPRLNDCLGTCESDSFKIELLPAGVAGDGCDENDCVVVLQEIVQALKDEGWPNVAAMFVRVPDIEGTYKSFAVGEGDDE